MDRSTPTPPDRGLLSPSEQSVVRILLDNRDKVIGRESLSRLAGLDAESARRVDSCLVAIRKAFGPDSIVTIRRRGWMLSAAGRRAVEKYLMSHENPDQ